MAQTKAASTWPVNENGEIVVQTGTGTTNVVAQLSQDNIPVDPVTGKVSMVGTGSATSPVPTAVTASRNLTAADNGLTLYSALTTAVTLTLVAGLPVGFGVAIVQNSTGQVTVAAGAGTTLASVSGFTKTSAQNAVIGIVQTTANDYKLVGSGA